MIQYFYNNVEQSVYYVLLLVNRLEHLLHIYPYQPLHYFQAQKNPFFVMEYIELTHPL